MTNERIIELLKIEHECMLRASHGDCDRNCDDCELVQDDSELHEMYTDVIFIMQRYVPTIPVERYHNDWRCGFCKREVTRMDSYCARCGREINWKAIRNGAK